MSNTTLGGQTSGTGLVRLLISTLVLIALAGVGYVALVGWPETASEAEAEAAVRADNDAGVSTLAAPAAMPVPVETAIAERSDLVMKITAIGIAEASRQLEVQAAVASTITQLPVQEGARVTGGDLLAAVDDTELRLKVQTQRETLVRAMARYAEKQAFLNDDSATSSTMREMMQAQEAVIGGVMAPGQFRAIIDDPRFDAIFETISREEVMASQDSLLTSRANFQTAEIELARARTLAPFKGQIAKLEAVVGQRVSPGTKLLTLVDADPLRVRVDVLESEAGLVREGRRAEVVFAAYPGQTFVGSIEAISPLVDADSKTLDVIVSLPNPELRLKPGMFAEIMLDTEVFRDRLLVPGTAVLLRDERPMLFVVEDGRSRWVYIRRGLENRDWVEVLEGIEPGDEVVTSGHYSLAHDAAVRVVDSDDSGKD